MAQAMLLQLPLQIFRGALSMDELGQRPGLIELCIDEWNHKCWLQSLDQLDCILLALHLCTTSCYDIMKFNQNNCTKSVIHNTVAVASHVGTLAIAVLVRDWLLCCGSYLN